MVDRNQMSLHTEPGCVQQNATQISTMINTTDCSYLADGNEGCATFDPSTSSYGEAFAQSGGGVWVTEFASTGISYVMPLFIQCYPRSGSHKPFSLYSTHLLISLTLMTYTEFGSLT